MISRNVGTASETELSGPFVVSCPHPRAAGLPLTRPPHGRYPDLMRRLTAASLTALALILAGCSNTTPPPSAPLTPEPHRTSCLDVGAAQAAAISEGLEPGITITELRALPAATGAGAWFVAGEANGPGLDGETFVFFTSADPENFTGGNVLAADNVTAEFVDWPIQDGAMLDDAFEAVKDCSA